jgi:quercetin dioxygenase-like cupin family protein
VNGTEVRSRVAVKTGRGMVVAALFAVGIVAPQPARPEDGAMPGVKRTDLQRHDISVAGYEAVQVRVDLDRGVAFGRHTHPGEEIIYVLDGKMEYDIDGKPPIVLRAGDVLFIPAGTVHAARNVGTTTASELATYIVEKGKPLLTLVK